MVNHQQLRTLLRKTLTLLCKNGLSYKKHLNVEATIGVTIDDGDILLVSINELVGEAERQKDTSDSEAASGFASSPNEPKRKRRRKSTRKLVTTTPHRASDLESSLIKPAAVPDHCYNTVFVKPERTAPSTSVVQSEFGSMQHTLEMNEDGTVSVVSTEPRMTKWDGSPPDPPDTEMTAEGNEEEGDNSLDTTLPIEPTRNAVDRRTTSLTYKEAIKILSNRERFSISYAAPCRPKGGEVFIVSSEKDSENPKEWRHDQYRWKVNQGVATYPSRTINYIIKKTMHKLKKGGTFTRHGWWLAVNPSVVLVHYLGDEKEADILEAQMNSNTEDKENP